jgi:RHS repeat-associated protein
LQGVVNFAGGASYYFHGDQLSNRLLTDSSGNVAGQRGEYPFGEPWYETGVVTKWKFTSYERDAESDNDYAMARTYRSRVARFLSADPVAGSLGNPESLNRYSYTVNDPINLVDPSGMDGCPPGYLCATGWGTPWPSGNPIGGALGLGGGGGGGAQNKTTRTPDDDGGASCSGPLSAGCLVQQAVARAIELLKNEKCSKFIQGDTIFDPGVILAELQSGDPQYGTINIAPIAPIQGSSINATTEPTGAFLGQDLSIAGPPVIGVNNTVRITMNSDQLNWQFPAGDDFGLSQTTRNALTILHELGHAINFMSSGFGSSGIVQDGPQVPGGMLLSRVNAAAVVANCLF